MKKKEEIYPEKYQGIKLKWIDNKPKYKKGDTVIVFKEGKYQEVILETLTQEPMQLKWVFQGRCRSCMRPGSTREANKFVYRWNDSAFTEGAEINVIKELNSLKYSSDNYSEQMNKLSHKASLYEQIKSSLKGELFGYDD